MAIVDVLERITQDGETELARIQTETEQTIAGINRDAQSTVRALEKEFEETKARRVEKIRERILADARRTTRFIHEKYTQQAMTLVEDHVVKQIAQMPTEAYATMITDALTAMKEDVRNATYTVAQERAEETRNILLQHGVENERIHIASHSGMLGGYEARTKDRVYTTTLQEYARTIIFQAQTEIAEKIAERGTQKK